MDLRSNRFLPRRQALRRDSGSNQSPGPSSSFSSKLPELVEWPKENQCPYNAHHIIPQEGMYNHLKKCRGNYKTQLAKEGKEVVYSNCKYNSDHEVISPELLHHESHCPEKTRQWSLLEQCKEKFDCKLDLLEHPQYPEEIQRKYEGLHLDKTVGGLGYGSEVPLEQINDPAPASMKIQQEAEEEEGETKKSQKAKEVTSEVGAAQGGDMVEAVAPSLPRRVRKKSFARAAAAEGACREAPEADESDDDDWEKSRKYPTFNLMEKLMNPSRPLFEYPPGLTKAQRKDFVKWNTQWINSIKQSEEKEKERENLHPATTVFVDPERFTRDVFIRNPEFEYP